MISKNEFLLHMHTLETYTDFESKLYSLTDIYLSDNEEISDLYNSNVALLSKLMELDIAKSDSFIDNIIIDYMCTTYIDREQYTVTIDDIDYCVDNASKLYDFIVAYKNDTLQNLNWSEKEYKA